MRNPGKEFEDQFKASVPSSVLIQRMPDPAQVPGSSLMKYTVDNPYDFFMYSYPTLFCLELKSTKSSSLTFWDERFIKDGTKQTFNIRKNQIEGLAAAVKYSGVIAGFVFNFRLTEHTYFFSIKNFQRFVTKTKKRSINEEDIVTYGGLLIEQKIKKVKYHYDIEKFIEDISH